VLSPLRAHELLIACHHRKWTKQEDRELIEAVRVCGNKNWQQVAHCLKDRTGQQCLHRWQKTLSPDIRKGRWSPLEDMVPLRMSSAGVKMGKPFTDANQHRMAFRCLLCPSRPMVIASAG
jgi:hypothetical protein